MDGEVPSERQQVDMLVATVTLTDASTIDRLARQAVDADARQHKAFEASRALVAALDRWQAACWA